MSIENENPDYPPKPTRVDCPVCGFKIYLHSSLEANKHGVISEFMVFKTRKETRLNYERKKEWERISQEVQSVSQKMKIPCRSLEKDRCYVCGECRKLYKYAMCKKCYSKLEGKDAERDGE